METLAFPERKIPTWLARANRSALSRCYCEVFENLLFMFLWPVFNCASVFVTFVLMNNEQTESCQWRLCASTAKATGDRQQKIVRKSYMKLYICIKYFVHLTSLYVSLGGCFADSFINLESLINLFFLSTKNQKTIK